MRLYASGKYHNKFETGYSKVKTIDNKEDLRLLLSMSDVCMGEFKDGYTQGGKFTKNHRARVDFVSSDCLYADFDNDNKTVDNQYKIEDFQEQFKNYEYYISTSKSHQIEKKDAPALDRFHVFFPIHTVTDGEKLKGYLSILHRKFFKMDILDKACIDSARFFYGAENNKTYYNSGKSIGNIIHKLWLQVPPKVVKPEVKLSSMYQKQIIKNLDKAYKLGWFDSYSNWTNLGMALKSSDFDETVWMKYCDTDQDIKAAEYKWKGFGDGTLGMNYLLSICKKMMK